MHKLVWGGEEGDWVPEDFFKIVTDDGEIIDSNIPGCNMRKSRDKRVKKHTLGLLVGAAPCGVVRILKELHGSESLTQVYGIVIEYLDKLLKQLNLNLRCLVYDDICHLVAFALGQLLLCRNQTTEYFNNLSFAIDRFHFPNHVDANCHQKFDPSTKPELMNVNTEICEQMFKGVNQYKNCRAMSEPTFKHFFRYNMDIHNLDIEGFANTLSNPHVQYWKESVKVEDVYFDMLQEI